LCSETEVGGWLRCLSREGNQGWCCRRDAWAPDASAPDLLVQLTPGQGLENRRGKKFVDSAAETAVICRHCHQRRSTVIFLVISTPEFFRAIRSIEGSALQEGGVGRAKRNPRTASRSMPDCRSCLAGSPAQGSTHPAIPPAPLRQRMPLPHFLCPQSKCAGPRHITAI
jgi:hypothetical protein